MARKLTTVDIMSNAKEKGIFQVEKFFLEVMKKNQNLFLKVLGHSDIFNRHYMLIGSVNQLIVISLDECKMEEIDNVNDFTTLKNYFMVISSDLQTSLYRQLGKND